MTQNWGRRARRLSTTIAVLACFGALGAGPASAQTGDFDPAKAVETVVEATRGGVQTPHPYNCREDHPKVQAIIQGVKDSLKYSYPDMSTMLMRGYAPYADAFLLGRSGGQGHWLNPGFLEDGHMMDPRRPEGILVDAWNRPIGVMFIADDPYEPGPDLYVDETTGVPCNAWHYHTEIMADSYWYAYKYAYSGDTAEGDLQPPDRTPDLMHVWAYGPYADQWQHGTPKSGLPPAPQSADEYRCTVGGLRPPGTKPC